MRIGILALQGAFAEHAHVLEKLGIEHCFIRQKADMAAPLDGMIIPGGESTTMGKLLKELELLDPIKERIESGLPVFGTCAGMILLTKQIENENLQYLGVMDTVVRRNAYGRQLGSFTATAAFQGVGRIPMVFIRAPYIIEAGAGVEVLARVDDKVVAARQENMLVTSFHPELTDDTKIHEFFLSMVKHP